MKKIFSRLVFSIAIAIMLMMSTTSCAYENDQEYVLNQMRIENLEWTKIVATFDYNFPEEVLFYSDVTAVYNVDDFRDAEWVALEEGNFNLCYEITRGSVSAPLVFVFDKSNRLKSKSVHWDFTMDMHVEFYSGNEIIKVIDKHYVHTVTEAYSGLAEMIKNVHTRTFGIQVDKHKNVKIIPDESI